MTTETRNTSTTDYYADRALRRAARAQYRAERRAACYVGGGAFPCPHWASGHRRRDGADLRNLVVSSDGCNWHAECGHDRCNANVAAVGPEHP
jgi:hypothetical protein